MAITIAGSGIVSANIADNQNLGIENFVPRGLICSNDSDASHDVAISVGGVRDATNTVNMSLAAILTKRIDAAWAVGDNNGGLDGTESSGGTPDASTMYYIWLIERSDTGVVDALYSESPTSPTMPTNYDYKRLIGSVLTDGSNNILPFTQTGDYFRYTTPVDDVTDTSIAGDLAYEDGTLSVPPLCIADVYGRLINTTTTHYNMYLFIKAKGGPETSNGADAWIAVQTGGVGDQIARGGTIPVNASRVVEYMAPEQSGDAKVDISTVGFWMLTRSNP
jgi:hypothetical protein